MTTNVYALIDIAAQIIVGNLILHKADAPAIRQFHDTLSNPQAGTINKHPEDFDLIHVGYIDDDTREMTGQIPVRTVLSGLQWKKEQNSIELVKEA